MSDVMRDDDVLFSYASYPPTEYLLPTKHGLLHFQCLPASKKRFRDATWHGLQNLAEDRPLIIGEFGMDTIRHSEEEQAEMLRWHIESVVGGGGWLERSFIPGLTNGCAADRTSPIGRLDCPARTQAQKALTTVKELFANDESMTRKVKLPRYPKVSVIVCSYNGAKTLDRCLESLKRLEYPNYEVILVDDGSKDNTQEIAARHPWIINIRQENSGLSAARNVGARAATGEVIAYTDSDCMADPEWLYFMVGTLLSGDFAGVGGPNISPPAENWIQACVAAAPGGPNHVLLSMSLPSTSPAATWLSTNGRFEKVGGFDPEYRKAGDDVDFAGVCSKRADHRLQPGGYRLALPAIHADCFPEATEGLWRSRIAPSLQAPCLSLVPPAPRNGRVRSMVRRVSPGSSIGPSSITGFSERDSSSPFIRPLNLTLPPI